MSVFIFGGAQLKDKPNLVIVDLKDQDAQVQYQLGEDTGIILNPGEPLIYVQTFFAPGDIVDSTTVDVSRRIRVLEILPWDRIERIYFEYTPVEDTPPSVWEHKAVMTPGRPATH